MQPSEMCGDSLEKITLLLLYSTIGGIGSGKFRTYKYHSHLTYHHTNIITHFNLNVKRNIKNLQKE